MATSDVDITEGSGLKVGSYTITEDTFTKHLQRISLNSSAGAEIVFTSSTIATGQVAPTSTAATLIASRAGRKSVTFFNSGAVDVWIGPATVTTANGFKLIPGASYTSYSEALWQAITASATGAIGYAEEY